jgi:predicted membrane protein
MGTAWGMKLAVKIAKVVQVGAGAGVVLAPMFLGKYRQEEAEIVEMFWFLCVALALACPVFLSIWGERKRARQVLVVTILLAVVAAGISSPQVIR